MEIQLGNIEIDLKQTDKVVSDSLYSFNFKALMEGRINYWELSKLQHMKEYTINNSSRCAFVFDDYTLTTVETHITNEAKPCTKTLTTYQIEVNGSRIKTKKQSASTTRTSVALGSKAFFSQFELVCKKGGYLIDLETCKVYKAPLYYSAKYKFDFKRLNVKDNDIIEIGRAHV